MNLQALIDEYRRVLRLMADGDEAHDIPAMGSPDARATLEWAIAVAEHHQERTEEDATDN